MSSVGPGVREIRAKDETGIYRAMYLATLAEAVYVLHAFAKKTQRTSRHDIELARSKLKALLREKE